MIDKLITEQLKKCSVARIPVTLSTHMHIQKYSDGVFAPLVGHYYLVQFADYILHESEGMTLSSNWNNGTKPLTTYNKVHVLQLLGEMVKLNCIGYDVITNSDLNNVWCGWVPVSAVQGFQEL